MRFFILVAIWVLPLYFLTAQDKKPFPQPDFPGDLQFDIGFNIWSKKNDSLKTWGSKSVGIYYNYFIKINESFSFNPALGFTFEKFAFEGRTQYFRQKDGSIALDTLSSSLSVKKNKLASTYLEIPLEIRYYPKKTEKGAGFFISAGGMVGFRIESHTKVKYTAAGTPHVEKLKGRFGLQDIRYGIQARVGWKNIHLFYKQYFSYVFSRDQTVVDGNLNATSRSFNPMLFTVGLNVSGF